jgi:trans-aconitate methyltransferase
MPQTWSPAGYAHHAGFVAALGAGILERLAPIPGERILDLGCGDGVLTARLAERGAAVVGVDASDAMIEAARARGLYARVMDARQLTFDGEFDAVFSNAALHWVHEADAVLAGVHRALKPRGRFVAEFGGFGCVAAIAVAIRAVMARHRIDRPWPWYFPTDVEYAARAEANGLTVEFVTLFNRPTPLPTGMAGWLHTFADSILGGLSDAERDQMEREMLDLLAPSLRDASGTWIADYVRLQIVARKP